MGNIFSKKYQKQQSHIVFQHITQNKEKLTNTGGCFFIKIHPTHTHIFGLFLIQFLHFYQNHMQYIVLLYFPNVFSASLIRSRIETPKGHRGSQDPHSVHSPA